jgi:hypothetical protein
MRRPDTYRMAFDSLILSSRDTYRIGVGIDIIAFFKAINLQ